jgi:LemA protein
MKWVMGAFLVLGVLLLLLGLESFLCEKYIDAPKQATGGIILTGIGVLLLLVQIYNRLVAGRNRCQMAMSNVDVLLKRRFDLVGNLVAVVGQYAAHENATFKEIAQYRSMATPPTAMSMAAKDEELGRRLAPTFIAIAEAYPELKADKNYRQLFDQLRETENGIASARVEYNRAVMEQNTRISTFPDVLVATKFAFTEHPFFSASDYERQVVSIARSQS